MEKAEQIAYLIQSKSYEKAFGLVIVVYSKQLYAVIFKIMQNHHDTDDVVQNTLIKIWHNLPNFKGNSSVYTWFYSIAKNEALAWIKKNKRYIAFPENEVLSSSNNSNNIAPERIWEILLNAVETLPEKQKLVFQQKYFEEKSYDEIAQATGTSIGGLKASYHHATKKIKEIVKNKSLY